MNALSEHKEPAERVGALISSTLLLIGVTFSTRLATLMFAVIVVRVLHATAYGEYSVAIGVFAIALVLVQTGMRVTGIRNMARNPNQMGNLLLDISAIWLIIGVIVAPLAILVVAQLGYSANLVFAIAILMLALFPTLIWQAVTMVCDAKQRFILSAPASLAIQVVAMVAGLVLIVRGGGVIGLVTGFLIASISVPLAEMAITGIRWLPSLKFSFRPSRWLSLIADALPIGMVNWFLIANYRVDSLILLQLRGARDVGLYSAAYSLIFGLTALSSSLQTALLPVLSAEPVHENPAQGQLSSAFRYGLATASLISVSLFTVGGPVIAFLYGQGFTPTADAFRILIWAVPFMLASAVLFPAQVARGGNRFLALSYGLLATFNITLNLLLIPPFGVVGASVATVASEALLAGILFFRTWNRSGLASVLRTTASIGLAGAIGLLAGLAGATIPILGKLWPLLAFETAFVCGLALGLLRIIRPGEVRSLARSMRNVFSRMTLTLVI